MPSTTSTFTDSSAQSGVVYFYRLHVGNAILALTPTGLLADPNGDADGDGVPNAQDGWPLEPALAPPRLSVSQYAVIDLGFQIRPHFFNDLGQVVTLDSQLWQSGTLTPLNALANSMIAFNNVGIGLITQSVYGHPPGLFNVQTQAFTPIQGTEQFYQVRGFYDDANMDLVYAEANGGLPATNPAFPYLSHDPPPARPTGVDPANTGFIADSNPWAWYTMTASQDMVSINDQSVSVGSETYSYLLSGGDWEWSSLDPIETYHIRYALEGTSNYGGVGAQGGNADELGAWVVHNQYPADKTVIYPSFINNLGTVFGFYTTYDDKAQESSSGTAAFSGLGASQGIVNLPPTNGGIISINDKNDLLMSDGTIIMDMRAGQQFNLPVTTSPQFSNPIKFATSDAAPPLSYPTQVRLNNSLQFVHGNKLWQNAHDYDLNSLIPPNSGWSSIGGLLINNNGAIVGTATYTQQSPSDPIAAGSHGVLLLPAEMAVDANHDGTIVMANDANNPANAGLPVDTTSAAKPFRFWLNEDQDDTDATFPGQTENLAPYNGTSAPYNSPGSYTPDCTLGTIHTKRNLEDFARLWIYTQGMNQAIHDGTIKVALKWENVTSGSPAINVYRAVETDGGSKYLTGDSATDPTDDSTAASQIADDDHNLTKGKITGTSPVVLDKSLFADLSTTNGKTYCLFEGAGVGTGKLVLVFENASGTVIGEGAAIYLDIRHVTDMYEQVQGQAATEPISQPTPFDSTATVTAEQNLQTTTIPLAAYTSNFTADANETTDTIVWVHGWNVYPERYEQQTQAMFKRLWWVGFKGRFAAYRWPSTDGEVDEWPGTLRTLVNGVLFDQIEYRAYKYASGLKTYISSKAATGNVYVVAHSLGAVISSEALKRGAPMAKLELMDSAASASCFDTNTADYQQPVQPVSDPDLSFHTDGTVNGGYRGYFQNLPAGKITSFFNVKDGGVFWWTVNNGSFTGSVYNGFKGGCGYPGNPISVLGAGHFYSTSTEDYTPVNSVFSYQWLNGHDPKVYRYVPDIHESMALMAFSRSGPLGYEPTITGPVGKDIDMRGVDYFGLSEQGHSPQMDENIQHHAIPFFQTIMTEANLTPSGP